MNVKTVYSQSSQLWETRHVYVLERIQTIKSWGNEAPELPVLQPTLKITIMEQKCFSKMLYLWLL